MKTRTLFSIILVIAVVFLAIFAARSIMRPEKYRQVYEARKMENVNNLLTIRSAQAVYKTVYKKYANNINDLVNFVQNGTVEIEKNIGHVPDTMTEAQAFKLGLLHKETVKVPVTTKMMEMDPNLKPSNFKEFQYIPGSNKQKQYQIQVSSLASKTYEIPVYRIDIPLDDILINMDEGITPKNSNVFKKFWDQIFYNNLAKEDQYKMQYDPMYMGSLTEASTTGSWE